MFRYEEVLTHKWKIICRRFWNFLHIHYCHSKLLTGPLSAGSLSSCFTQYPMIKLWHLSFSLHATIPALEPTLVHMTASQNDSMGTNLHQGKHCCSPMTTGRQENIFLFSACFHLTLWTRSLQISYSTEKKTVKYFKVFFFPRTNS